MADADRVYTWMAGEGRKQTTRQDVEDQGIESIDVFISHKQEDASLAVRVGDILYEEGLHSYLDIWDPSLRNARDIEGRILNAIQSADVLLAIITAKTKLSWWVPFEIGVARVTDSQIVSCILLGSGEGRELPSYLESWPRLASEAEIRGWAKAYRRARLHETPATITRCMQTLSDLYELGHFKGIQGAGRVRFVTD